VDDKKGMVTSYTNLGNYYTGLGNSDSTISCYQKAYSIAFEIKDTILQAYTLGAVGFAYVHTGKSQEALTYLFKSVKLMEENGTREDAYPALQGIGNVFAQLGEHRKAISYFDSAIVLAKAKPNYISLSNLVFLQSNALIRLNQPDSAIIYLEPAISVARQINYLDMELAALIKMGSTYLDLGDTTKALAYFRLSLDKNREAQLRENLQESYFYMGIIMLSKNKIDSAYYYARLAEKTLEGLQFNSAHKQVEFLLTNVYERKGDYKNALSSYKKFIVFRDSVDNQRVFRTTLEKQFQYESEKKDLIAKAEQEKKDIQLQAQKNRLVISTISFGIILALGGTLFYTNRKRKETVYKQHLAESEMKALRAQMNPHFMFNSLNAIQQMVLNNENENAFRYLDTYSKLTRKILENSEKKWITLQDEIKFLELYLQIESLRFQNAFTYEIIVEPDVSVHDDKIPAMIIQPLVENAIKHGLLRKENDGKLLVVFRKQPGNGTP
jgi:tetratricopeptide (TPR) repeat protein